MLLASLRRMAHIFLVLIRHAMALIIGGRLSRWPSVGRYLPVGLKGPERLRVMIEEIGGTFVKFGQMLALQPDVLSIEYCNALFNLLDRVAPFGFEQVEMIFVQELGKSPLEIFDSFDKRPIATASIGQVHVAYLDKRKLAVKVQRPSVQIDFAGDIRLMTAMIRLIESMRLKGLYWLVEPTKEFIAWTAEELDYRREARYLEQHRTNARNNPTERVPAVLMEFTTRRTLVAEFLDGVTVLDYIRALESGDEFTLRRLEGLSFEPNQFVCNILDNFLGDAYQYGMFHADLHPANLMILPGNVIGYVDFGITGVLSRFSRQNLVALTQGLGRGDLDAMCTTFFKISSMDSRSDADGFRAGITGLAEDWYGEGNNGRRLTRNATHVMFEMLKLSRKTGIYPERDVVKYIRSAIAIDGLITRAAPGFDLGQHLDTICNHYLKWQARRALFSYNTFLDWSNASGHLMRDGAIRAASFIERISAGEMPVRAEIDRGSRRSEDPLRWRAMLLGGIVLVVSLLITATSERVQLGVNLFTAEAVVIAGAALMLLRTIGGLSRDGQ